MAGLKSATGFVRGELGRRVRLRRTPEIIFVEDRGLERGDNILNLISRLSRERKDEDPNGESVSTEGSISSEDLDHTSFK